MSTPSLKPFSWERMVAAVEATRQRALRASQALTQAGIPFVVVGGHAVAAWVARVDLEAVRNTKDVDLLIQRNDLPGVIIALSQVGFVYQQVNGVELFLDGEQGSDRSGIHLVFAGEKVHANYGVPAPQINEFESGPDFPVLSLEALVRMKLTSFRPQDQTHLLDLVGVDWSTRVGRAASPNHWLTGCKPSWI